MHSPQWVISIRLLRIGGVEIDEIASARRRDLL
jgi:hypothetical protein